MATVHTAIRAYILECMYNDETWVDDPSNLITAVQTALSGITDLNSYNQINVSNVRNASKKQIEVEIVGITYTNKTRLNVTENDSLISDLTTAFNGISNFTYTDLNITNDIFTDDETSGWPGDSFEET